MRQAVVAGLLLLIGARGWAPAGEGDAPSHGRPFFMPPGERARIRALTESEQWAKGEPAQLSATAEKGDGSAAALLYASDGYVRLGRDSDLTSRGGWTRLRLPGAGGKLLRDKIAALKTPPREVAFEGTKLSFALPCLTGDHWTVGFCKPGELDAWRWKK